MKFLSAILMTTLLLISSAFAGEIKGDFKFPSDIAVSDGKIYVVDGLNGRIVILKSDGTVLKTVKDTDKPFGIYVEGGKAYVATQTGKVKIYNTEGALLKSFDVGGRLIDVVKAGGNLWVTDAKNDNLKVISLNSGEVIKTVGEKGSAPGEFVSPFMITKVNGSIYVVDSINARIEVFDENGNLERTFGDFGVEEGKLFRPKGVVAVDGDLAISDVVTGAVQLFNPYGAFDGVVAKGLQYPIAIAYDNGAIYVLEPLKNKILTFNVQGVK